MVKTVSELLTLIEFMSNCVSVGTIDGTQIGVVLPGFFDRLVKETDNITLLKDHPLNPKKQSLTVQGFPNLLICRAV